MNICYSPAARDDLRALRRYLTDEFGEDVASRALARIVSAIAGLKEHPGLARPLSDKIRRPTGYLYLLCSRQSIAILSAETDAFSVIRILDARTDYARIIFGE